MTGTIAIIGGKGGVTKSTIARAIAVTYAIAEWSVLAIPVDLGQSTLTNWMKRRMEAGKKPVFDVIAMNTPSAVEAKIKSGHWDLAIIDTGAYASKMSVGYAELAQLVVVPTSFSLDDMPEAVSIANSLIKGGIPIEKIAIVFSGVSENKQDYIDAQEYMGHTPYHVVDGYIPRMPSLSKAQDKGLAITECSYANPRNKADHVIQGIIDRFEQLTAERS